MRNVVSLLVSTKTFEENAAFDFANEGKNDNDKIKVIERAILRSFFRISSS
jgi:hypothetical protein